MLSDQHIEDSIGADSVHSVEEFPMPTITSLEVDVRLYQRPLFISRFQDDGRGSSIGIVHQRNCATRANRLPALNTFQLAINRPEELWVDEFHQLRTV
ncbi:hypothetical protein D3C87_1716160 [compost metagenome]